MPDEVQRQLSELRALLTEESLILSVVLDLGLSVEHGVSADLLHGFGRVMALGRMA